MKLATLVLLVVACGAMAVMAEDYTQRWNYVHHHMIGDVVSERQFFNEWKVRMKKTYKTGAEEEFRFGLFQKSLKRVIAKNDKLPAGKSNYGVNKFSDLDTEEWARLYLSTNPVALKKQYLGDAAVRQPNLDGDAVTIPTSWDWRQQGAVTYVKDQGQCGSCWAFSVVETVESEYYIKHNSSVDLSPQQIVDCDWGDGDQGCDGGDPFTAYSYVIKNGLMSDDAYPYFSGDSGINGTCTFNASQVVARISNFTFATPPCWNGTCANQNDVLLAQNLYTYGPTGIIVDASQWQDYTWGSFSDCSSAYADMDHGVQVVGFDFGDPKTGLVGSWMVRNSWGEDWGEDGYIDLAGSSVGNNMCGISNEAIFVEAM